MFDLRLASALARINTVSNAVRQPSTLVQACPPVKTNSNKIVNPPLRRDWHVVADDLKEEHDPLRRTQLLQELADSIWFEA